MAYRHDEDAQWYQCTHPSKITSSCLTHSAKTRAGEMKLRMNSVFGLNVFFCVCGFSAFNVIDNFPSR